MFLSICSSHVSQAMSNVQRDGKACVKFSKGILYVLITLMIFLNTSSDFFSVCCWDFDASLFGHLDFSSVPEDASLRSGTEGSYQHLVQQLNLSPAEIFLAQASVDTILRRLSCTSSCAFIKGRESGATGPQALTCLQLIPFPEK